MSLKSIQPTVIRTPGARVSFILIHGYTGSPTDFMDLPQLFSARYSADVLVPLLPGHGTRVEDLGPLSYADFIAAIDPLVTQEIAAGKRVILAGAIQGKESMIILAALAKQGLARFWIALIFFILGEMAMDMLLFSLARLGVFRRVFGEARMRSLHDKANFLLKRMTGDHLFVPLFISKLVYGTAMAMIVYCGENRSISTPRFIRFMALSTLLLTSAAAAVGLALGATYSVVIGLFKDVQIALSVVVLCIILIIVFEVDVSSWLRRRMETSDAEARD